MKSWLVHYRNKYPGGRVFLSEDALDVFDAEGNQRVALRKSGAGGWNDESEVYGCIDRHDLAPIPKDARVYKMENGKLGLDELHAERSKKREAFLESGKILSCEELKKKGLEFDDKQRVVNK